MPWWSFPVVILAPLAVFAVAWSFGRVGDYAQSARRRGLAVSATSTMIAFAAFLVQVISYWTEGNLGLGFWITAFGALAGLVAIVAQARELRRSTPR